MSEKFLDKHALTGWEQIQRLTGEPVINCSVVESERSVLADTQVLFESRGVEVLPVLAPVLEFKCGVLRNAVCLEGSAAVLMNCKVLAVCALYCDSVPEAIGDYVTFGELPANTFNSGNSVPVNAGVPVHKAFVS